MRLAGKLGMSSGPCEAAGTRGSARPGRLGGPAVKRLLAADEVRVGAGREAELECEQLERRGAGQEGFGARDRVLGAKRDRRHVQDAGGGRDLGATTVPLAAVVGIETQQHESGIVIGGGKVTVEDFLHAERGGGNVAGFFELEGQFGGGDLIDAGSDHQEAPAVGEAVGVLVALGSGGELSGDELARTPGAPGGEGGVKEQG